MKRVSRDVVYVTHSRHNAPTLTVAPGETFLAETELCSGPWLRGIEDVYTPEKGRGPNPTVVIAVEGAHPGQCLAVHVEQITPAEVGYTAMGPGGGAFPDWIRNQGWGLVTRTVAIRDGFVEWSPKLRIPTAPMVGTLGTAPAREEFTNAWPGRHGGNMDAQEVCAGATVYLPVEVEGALLHVGDVHAIQGDGEVNGGGGIECRAEVTMRVDLVERPRRMGWPRIVDDTHLIAVGCARPAEDAFRLAVEQLVYWMADDYGFEEPQAVLLLGQVLEARCTQFVDPLYTYVAKVRKEYVVKD